MPLLEKKAGLVGTTGEGAQQASGAAGAVAAAAEAVPEQSRAERRTSFDPADFPVPHGREEDWRFTPIDRLGVLLDESAAQAAVGAELHVEGELPQGVSRSAIDQDAARTLGVAAPGDRAAALAFANSTVDGQAGALHWNIAAETELAQPVRIRLTGDGSTVFGHTVLTVGRHARATVILEHTGAGAYDQLLSVLVGDGAELTLVSLQDWDDDALHLGQHDIRVGRDATVRHIAISLGGKVVRLCTNASYAGPGGTFEGLGLYFADAGQHLENRLFVDHEAPKCSSDVLYHGALQGDTAHTVWIGDVLIRSGAEDTETYEMNRNLLLTQGARADSVPNLEIETGEIVGAGHASATGRFDDEQLFYLQARGIPTAEARRLVVRGFFATIANRIGVDEVVAQVMTRVEHELAGTEAAASAAAEVETPAGVPGGEPIGAAQDGVSVDAATEEAGAR